MSASAMLEAVEDASTLAKVAVFLVVQALVCLILLNSSDLFSRNKMSRSFSFKPARSVSIRRILAVISDLPLGGEPSPSGSSAGRSGITFPEYLSMEDLASY
ncbi:uncharacterized protein LOC116211691 [Punica granatum]|uniref:Uncharacterized protein LOC116211691 n=1 Tax=Punica granatum TaxID=22663 RepID=A0A218WA74_PUNGR|nr:uncharacterized protein LOC116211691 [Punica granatum]OWM69250.1 hypothetical protein CDL15_Pgr025437 [Punica granatum]